MSKGFVLASAMNQPVKVTDPYGSERICVAFIEYSDGVSWSDQGALSTESFSGPPPWHHLYAEVTHKDGNISCDGYVFEDIDPSEAVLNAVWVNAFLYTDVKDEKLRIMEKLRHDRSALDAEKIKAGS